MNCLIFLRTQNHFDNSENTNCFAAFKGRENIFNLFCFSLRGKKLVDGKGCFPHWYYLGNDMFPL